MGRFGCIVVVVELTLPYALYQLGISALIYLTLSRIFGCTGCLPRAARAFILGLPLLSSIIV